MTDTNATERARDALQEAHDAIAEYYRYWTGGETRGSYDGKPERTRLWNAREKARAALAATPKAPTSIAGEEERMRKLLADAFAAEGLDYSAQSVRDGDTLASNHWARAALNAMRALASQAAPNDDLRAENERLREALRTIERGQVLSVAAATARAALKENRRG